MCGQAGTVRVRLFAALADAAGTDDVRADPAPLSGLLAHLTREFGEPFATRLAVAAVLIEGTAVARDADVAVPAGSEVVLLPPFSGGAGSAGADPG